METDMTNKYSTDVLIVGLGPVGAALANLLGRQGVNTLVVDKATEIFQAPRAIALDNEALRVLQLCGLKAGEFDTVAIPEVRMHSPLFGSYSRAVTAGSIDCHPKLVTFFQPQLEAVLRERLAAYSHVEVKLGLELKSFSDRGQGVESELVDAHGQPLHVSSRYIVGADGANSLVRRLLGQDFQGKTYAEDWLVVDAKHVPKAIDHVEFICDPKRPTPHMVAPGQRQRWEFKLQPGETREEMERPEMVRQLLRPWTDGRDIDIERVAVYRFHARVADTFQVGKAFLVGDAAHITPPFVGQGLVAGLRDVANLAWKLAWVVQAKARPELLGSYTTERRPHVRAMINLAKIMGQLVMPRNVGLACIVHGLMKTLSHVPKLRHLFERLEIKPANRFKAGCFESNGKGNFMDRGSHMPQVWLKERGQEQITLSDDALGQNFVMIGFGVNPAQDLSPELVRQWQAIGGRFMCVAAAGSANQMDVSVSTWEDFDGRLMPDVAPHGWVAIVRPDKVIMHDGPLTAAASMLKNMLSRIAGTEWPASALHRYA